MGPGSSRGLKARSRLVLGFGHAMDSLFTWGLEPSLRESLLAERQSDRLEEVAEGAPLMRVAGRSLRTVAADLWARTTDRRAVTALPVALTYLILGAAASMLGTRPMPAPQRVSYILVVIGLLALGAAGLASPLALHRVGVGTGSALLSVGAFLNAATFNIVAETLLSDLALTLALLLAGAGYLGVAVGLAALDERLIRLGAWGVLAALWTLAVAVALWAVENTIAGPSELAGAALLVVGCVVGANSFARLRHLPVKPARPAA